MLKRERIYAGLLKPLFIVIFRNLFTSENIVALVRWKELKNGRLILPVNSFSSSFQTSIIVLFLFVLKFFRILLVSAEHKPQGISFFLGYEGYL